MRSFVLSLRCRAAFRAAPIACLFVLAACAADPKSLVCTGGSFEYKEKCVCGQTEELADGVCVHQRGLLPNMTSNVVDAAGNTGNGLDMELDSKNYPHVAHYEANNADLRYGTLDRATGKWIVENIDVQGDVGREPALAITEADGTARPVITYYDTTARSLKGAFRSASGWVVKYLDPQNVDQAFDRGRSSSVAVDVADGKNIAHVSYLDPISQDLYHLRWDLNNPNDISEPRQVDSGFSIINGQQYGSGVLDDETSIALDSRGAPVIAYRDRVSADLKVAVYNPDSDQWSSAYVDNDPAVEVNSENLGEYASIAIDAIDNYHVAYYDRTYQSIRYAEFDGSAWTTEVVERGNVGAFASIKLRDDRSPFIAYYDATKGGIKLAHKRRDGLWQIEFFSAPGISGRTDGAIAGMPLALSLTDLGWPALAYREFFSKATYFDYVLTLFP